MAPSASPAARVERLYERCGGALRHTLEQSFGVPPDEADGMLRDALHALITSSVPDDEAWLIAAVCRLGATWRAQDAFDARVPPDPSASEVQALRDALFLRHTIETLTPDAQEALRMRFAEGCGYGQIAERLDVSVRYVKRLIIRSLQKLRSRRSGR